MPQSLTDTHALILTPVGRDAQVAAALLAELDIATKPVGDVALFTQSLDDKILFAVVTEESLRTSDLRELAEWVRNQPSWSDLAFILLTRHGGGPERNPAAARISETLGNVTFLERPFHPTTFLSVSRAALEGRKRQYESRSTLAELAESGERLRTALIAGRLGAWELDVATNDLTMSDACKAVFGRGPDDPFSYEELLSSIHPDDRFSMRESIRLSVETGRDHVIEYRTRWPDGSAHWADMRARLTSSRDGARMVGVSSDITARKQAEEQLRLQNETLEARVAERTIELEEVHRLALEQMAQREAAENKLRQSQKLETIGQLTGGIAHDFNNLLTVVLGNLALLNKHLGDHDPKATRLIDGAMQGAQRGASLTQRLLAFARRQDLSIAASDLAELVRGMTQLIERTVGTMIEVLVDLPERPAWARVDVNQVEMALLNLVINARDAMPDGGTLRIAVDCGAWPSAEGRSGPYVRLTVGDTGHGMDAITLEKAAEPFFSTKGVGKGTGLGLSMIHGLVQQLGGEFRLASEIDRGTTAELLFPATEKVEVIAPPLLQHELPSAARRLRILMVDDDALVSMSGIDMLEDLGHEVLEADSGEAALRYLSDGEHVDLMITDFSMPRMNGAQLANAVRKLRPDLPIILATGYAELLVGADLDLPRLGKPYDQRQLEAQINALMCRSA